MIEHLSKSLESNNIDQGDVEVVNEAKNLVKLLQDLEQDLHQEFQKLLFYHYKQRILHFFDVSSSKLKKYTSLNQSTQELERNIARLDVRL